MLNKAMLIGHLGQDPEKRVMQNGESVVNISVATTEKWNDKQGQKQEKTEWHKVVFFKRLADVVSEYCKRGSKIYVEGSLQTREWTDKDGNRRFSTEINGRSVQLLDSKPQNGQQQGGYQNQQNPTYQPAQNYNQQVPPQVAQSFPDAQVVPGEFVEDDIPF